ncbi:MAG: hypothetical protein L0Z53_18175 [Acidobacteriales bacterium]|nr:hypothetical protein [Terriglobales bacterium]
MLLVAIDLNYSQAIILLLAIIGVTATLGRLAVNRFGNTNEAAAVVKKNSLHPGISMHHIPIGGGIAGLLFVIACWAIFLGRVPVLRYFFALSIVMGIGLAIAFYRARQN